MNPVALDILMHYGVGHENGGHSGRYPFGSGENPYQHSGDLLSRIEEMQKEGMTEKEIAKELGLSTTQLRTQKSLAKAYRRAAEVSTAKKLRDEGYNPTQIAEMMGYKNESSIRNLLNAEAEARMNAARDTADRIKEVIDKKGIIDVGEGVEKELGVSREKFEQALYILESEGYPVYKGRVEQATNKGKYTTLKVIGQPGTEYSEMYDFDKVEPFASDYISPDGVNFVKSFQYPASLDSKRLQVVYPSDDPSKPGGESKDGLIEIRPGVPDLSLGDSHYAQVRILVDGTHYLKGMAAYADDLPEGIDIRFNTSKPKDMPIMGDDKNNTVLKKIKKDDPNNPFGSLIKEEGGQYNWYDEDGNPHLSLINKRGDEGDWGDWEKKLPSQFLSKQPQKLIDQQLNLTLADKREEFESIMALTNPTVKRAMLDSFADDCDSAAVHLKAAALPEQRYQVLLPLTTLKDNEVYAPNYKDGDTVALIRYPHAGTFEIPIVKVNNKNEEGKKLITPNAEDAIGINRKVAERLSGADFDGDTVMVIPCNSPSSKVKIKSTPALFEGFDPHLEYGGKPEGTYKRMTKENTQMEMGKISNLITDMTLQGATNDELARAVKHSMVVIDAEKHGLDYKQSEIDNRIPELKKKYQGRYDEEGRYHEGAATLISKAKGEYDVPKRRGSPITNPDGSLSYKTAYDKDLYYVDKNGKTQMRTEKSTQMAETSDAFTLVSASRTPQELAYARYANSMKSLANTARKEKMATGRLLQNKEAKEKYSEEVKTLMNQLEVAESNAPRERQAQLKTNAEVKRLKQSNPDMKKDEEKKIRQQALTRNRAKYGAQRHSITFTDREWEAIQAGAISDNVLTRIIRFADSDELKTRATPRSNGNNRALSEAKQAKIRAMAASGYTNKEIAQALNIPVSTVADHL